jgi:hypothetical protein
MPRLCRCGKIVKDRCECQGERSTRRGNTKQAGYDSRHRLASERYRADRPLCERCVMLYGVINARPSRDMHHIEAIRRAPERRMDASNWLAVCGPCHEDLEGDSIAGAAVKRWSEGNYDGAMVGFAR